MLQPQQIEDLICLISSMNRPALIHQFRSYRARFPLDFSDEFLCAQSVERLRHIFMAICIQSQHIPGMLEAEAA